MSDSSFFVILKRLFFLFFAPFFLQTNYPKLFTFLKNKSI
ncbi:hypothetical protein IGI66_000512 [Enterococcus sp. AZ048]